MRPQRRRVIWLLLGAALALMIVLAAAGWWQLRHWQPPRAAFPMQGVEVGSDDGAVDWRAIKAVGADFAYIDAGVGAATRDPAFSRNLEQARAAGLQVGAVHRYDPCLRADSQAANFVATVPRDTTMLPPAIDLTQMATACPTVNDASVESELMTFLNEVETHTGRASLLKISQAFESRYHLGQAIHRNLWLESDRFMPTYGSRPWTLWTANSALHSDAADRPLRWVVVRP